MLPSNKKPDIGTILLDPIGSIYFRSFQERAIDEKDIGSYFVEGVGEDHLARCMDFEVINDVIRFDDRCHLRLATS